MIGANEVKLNVLPGIVSTSYVAAVNVTLLAGAKPTVIKPPLFESSIINPESPGFAVMVVKPFIVFGDVGLIVNEPVPLLRKPIYQPVDKLEIAGSVNVPTPEFQTKVAARLLSLITGLVVKSIGFCVVANLPDTVVKPEPANDAASA